MVVLRVQRESFILDYTNKTIKKMNDVTKRFIEAYKNLALTGYRMGKESKVIVDIPSVESDIIPLL